MYFNTNMMQFIIRYKNTDSSGKTKTSEMKIDDKISRKYVKPSRVATRLQQALQLLQCPNA